LVSFFTSVAMSCCAEHGVVDRFVSTAALQPAEGLAAELVERLVDAASGAEVGCNRLVDVRAAFVPSLLPVVVVRHVALRYCYRLSGRVGVFACRALAWQNEG